MNITDFLEESKELKKLWEDPSWRLIDTQFGEINSFRFQQDGSNALKTVIVDINPVLPEPISEPKLKPRPNNVIEFIENDLSPREKIAIDFSGIQAMAIENVPENEAVYFSKVMDKYVFLPEIETSADREGKIKLAILDNSFSVGGAVWSIVLLLKYLDKSKIYPRAYSGSRSDINDYLKDMEIEVNICPGDIRKPGVFEDWIVESLKEWQPDVVDGAWSVHWGFHEFREFVPVVVAHAQATEIPWLDPETKVGYCSYDQELVDNLDGIICVAQAVYDKYPIIQDKAVVIPSPIDTDDFIVDKEVGKSLRYNLDIDEDAFVISWVGRISEQKRPDLLLEIVDLVTEKIDNAVFLVAACLPKYFESHPIAQKWLNGLNGRPIIWIPDMKPYHAPVFYSMADLFLLNSDWEGLSLTSLEALAAGIPVVCTDVSGQAEIIEHGENGVLCPKGDVQALANAIVEVHDWTEHDLENVGENAQRSVEKVSAKLNAERTLAFYEKLLERQ